MSKRLVERNGLLAIAGLAGAMFLGRKLMQARRFMTLSNKVAVITGGSRGLGLNIARVCVERGARIAICSRDETQLERAKIELMRRGGEVLALRCDVTDRAALQQFVRDVVARFGRIDYWFNNAGVIQVGPLRDQTRDDYGEALATHLLAPLNAIEAILPVMRGQGSGRIINIASIGGKQPVPHMLPYTVSKHALVGLSEGLRVELARENIFVTTVIPGLFTSGSARNAFFKGQNEKEYAWFATGGAMPVMAMNVQRLARQIVAATQHGDAELVTPFAAKLQASVAAVMPNLTAEVSTIINAMLPSAGGIQKGRLSGKSSESSATPAFAQAAHDRAAAANNEF